MEKQRHENEPRSAAESVDPKSIGGCEFGCVSLDVTISSFLFHKICFHVHDTVQQICRSECRRKRNLLRLMPGLPSLCFDYIAHYI